MFYLVRKYKQLKVDYCQFHMNVNETNLKSFKFEILEILLGLWEWGRGAAPFFVCLEIIGNVMI